MIRISVIRNIIIIITIPLIIHKFSIDRMERGGNGNSPHGNLMGMGISQKNWEWGWEGMGIE